MDFSKALIRCHRIGDIMVDPQGCITDKQLVELTDLTTRTKPLTDNQKKRVEELEEKKAFAATEPLSKSCEVYLMELYWFLRHGRKFKDKSQFVKQIQKGTQVEEDSLDMIAALDNRFYLKNEERLDDDHFTGIPDTYLGESVFNADWVEDIKSSWDLETFAPNVMGVLNPTYWWQMQGYFALTGAREGAVSFCLVNTPESLINDETKRLFYKMDVATEENPDYLREKTLLEYRMRFDNIPIEERRVRFYVKRDDDAIERARKRVERCRKWLADYYKKHMDFIAKQTRQLILNNQPTETEQMQQFLDQQK